MGKSVWCSYIASEYGQSDQKKRPQSELWSMDYRTFGSGLKENEKLGTFLTAIGSKDVYMNPSTMTRSNKAWK